MVHCRSPTKCLKNGHFPSNQIQIVPDSNCCKLFMDNGLPAGANFAPDTSEVGCTACTAASSSRRQSQLPVGRPLAQNASFLAFQTANLDSWLLAQNLVSILRRTGSADSAEPSRSSCTERPGCSKAAKWSPFFSSLLPLPRAFGRRLLQRRTP